MARLVAHVIGFVVFFSDHGHEGFFLVFWDRRRVILDGEAAVRYESLVNNVNVAVAAVVVLEGKGGDHR